jgi:hypothetical protein
VVGERNADMEKNIVILRTALDVDSYLGHDLSTVSSGIRRMSEYISGISSLTNYLKKYPDTPLMFLDNTLSSNEQIPQEIIDVLPKNAILRTTGTNEFGRFNKGAGDIETWTSIRDEISEYKVILHYEGRLRIRSERFLNSFFKSPRSMVCREIPQLMKIMNKSKSVSTGYFGIDSGALIEFVKNVDPEYMTEQKIAIEHLFYDYCRLKQFEMWSHSGYCWRSNPNTGKSMRY